MRIEGKDKFRQQAESAKTYFKTRKQTIRSYDYKDSIVTVSIAYKAILAIDIPNGLKSGESLELKGQSIFSFQNGKIKTITDIS